MTDPRVSVVTINRNTGDSVRRTVASLLEQDLPFEWVVVDGGSTDASIGHLRAAQRPGDRLVSEKDQGISDAFNKGINLATGEAVLFMNAGDEFAAPDALRQLVSRWDRSRHRWITGTAEVIDESGRALYRRDVHQPSDPLDLVRSGCRIFHQATLAEKALFAEFGGFDLGYRIAMDYELWLRWLRAGVVPQVVPVVVCRYRTGGVSGNVVGRFTEDRRARAAHRMVNPWWIDAKIGTIVRLKSVLRGRTGPWAYQVKEALKW